MSTFSHAQNFYILKIHLNLFEILNRVLKFENSKYTWKVLSRLKKFISNMDPSEWCNVSVFTLLHDKLEYMHMALFCMVHVWLKFTDTIKKFRLRINFQIFKLDLWFQINSNGFSRHRSFGHCDFCFAGNPLVFVDFPYLCIFS